MRAVSDRFRNAVTGSHTPIFEAYTLLGDTPDHTVMTWQTGDDPATFGDYMISPGRAYRQLPITGGDVDLDGNADIRSTLDLTVPGLDPETGEPMFPLLTDDRLAPYGQEIFIRRGIRYAEGDEEWCSLGYFRIQSVEQLSSPEGLIYVQGQDRMAGIIDARLLYPRQFAAATTYGGLMESLVGEVYPDVDPAEQIWEFDDPDLDSQAIGRDITIEQDRYAALKDVVTALGKICYFDGRGILVIKDVPQSFDPVFRVASGSGGTLIRSGRRRGREEFFNAAVAYGEATDDNPPVQYAVVDADPDSPTYFYGRFGQVPRYFYSQFLTTVAQCENAARGIMSKYTGVPSTLEFTAVPNPAFEPFDVGTVHNRGRTDLHSIERLTIPLDVTRPITHDTKEKRSTLMIAP